MELFVIAMFWFHVVGMMSNAILFYINKDIVNSLAVVFSIAICMWASNVLGWL